MIYPPDLVSGLIERLGNALPLSSALLAEVLNAAYAATLLEEEGRRTPFTLALVDPSTSEANFVFASPRAFDAQRIVKLAPAVDHRQTFLGVDEHDGKLRIWGLVHLGDRQFGIDKGEIMPPIVRIIGWRPGVLTVDFAEKGHAKRLLRYSGGQAHWYGAESTVSDELKAAASLAAPSLQVDADQLAREYERLAERLVRSGHGGTLLFFQHGDELPRDVSIPETGRFEPSNTLLRTGFSMHAKYEKNAGQPTELTGYVLYRHAQATHQSALDYVAALANVDGAVVMCPDLTVLGFGATITSKMVPSSIVEIDPREPTRTERRLQLSDFPGHRHKSAAQFCASQLPRDGEYGFRIAFAIVASQDGALSVFAINMRNEITVLRPFILRRTE